MRSSYFKRPLFLILLCYLAVLFFVSPDRRFNIGVRDVSFFISDRQREIEAKACEFPLVRRNKLYFPADIFSVDGKPAEGRAMVSLPAGQTAAAGEKFKIQGKIKIPGGTAVYGNFNWRGYLQDRGIYSEIEAASLSRIEKAGFLMRAAGAVRSRTLSVFGRMFSPDKAAVISGITLGEKASMSGVLREAFQDAGVVHVLVASGSNVGFTMWIVYMVLAAAGIRRRYGAAIALACAGFYTLCAGADAPLVRAYIMAAAATVGFVAGRLSGAFQGLILSCLLILFWDPYAVSNPGFQMSFLATFGIIVAGAMFRVPDKWHWSVKTVLRLFILSAGAQLVLLPVMAANFHKVSLIALISNIVLVPFSGVIMGAGFIIAFLSFIPWPALVNTACFFTGWILSAFEAAVRFFGSADFAVFKTPALSLSVIAVYYSVLVLACCVRDFKFMKKAALVCGMVCVAAVLYDMSVLRQPKIYIFAAGPAKSVLLKSPSGETVLVNAGIKGGMLQNAVLEAGSSRIGAIFLSSFDERSWKGLEELSSGMKIDRILLPYGTIPPQLARIAESHKIKTIMLWDGDSVSGDGWQARALWGLHKNRRGFLWSEPGYSGHPDFDAMSYSFGLGQGEVVSGADAGFALMRSNSAAGAVEFDIISRRGYSQSAVISRRGVDVRRI